MPVRQVQLARQVNWAASGAADSAYLFEFCKQCGRSGIWPAPFWTTSVISTIPSAGPRRLPPFRRQDEYRDNPDMMTNDGEVIRMMALTGYARHLAERTPPMQWNFEPEMGMEALQGTYRLPDVVMDLIFRQAGDGGFNTFERSANTTEWRSTPDPSEFLISAGAYTHHFPLIPLLDERRVGDADPPIPNGGGVSATDLIRIVGHQNIMKKRTLAWLRALRVVLRRLCPRPCPAAKKSPGQLDVCQL